MGQHAFGEQSSEHHGARLVVESLQTLRVRSGTRRRAARTGSRALRRACRGADRRARARRGRPTVVSQSNGPGVKTNDADCSDGATRGRSRVAGCRRQISLRHPMAEDLRCDAAGAGRRHRWRSVGAAAPGSSSPTGNAVGQPAGRDLGVDRLAQDPLPRHGHQARSSGGRSVGPPSRPRAGSPAAGTGSRRRTS